MTLVSDRERVRSHNYVLPELPVSDDVRASIVALDTALTAESPVSSRVYGEGVVYAETGSFTQFGLEWLIDVIKKHRLPIAFASDHFGFNSFRATVYNHHYIPSESNTRQLEVLITFSDRNFSWPKPEGVSREVWIVEVYARLIELLAPNDAYGEVLRFYGFEKWPSDGEVWVY